MPDRMGALSDRRQHVVEVFLAFLKLGCTSFGGPVAHLGYFRAELVNRRRWLDDHAFGELVGLCQFLPGPASSQVCFGIGMRRAGPLGGPAAWIGFTFPSALLMLAFASAARKLAGPGGAAAIHGLKVVAVAVVAHALVGMVRSLTPDLRRKAMALIAMAATLAIRTPALQVALIAAGAAVGSLLRLASPVPKNSSHGWSPSKTVGLTCLAVFAALFVGLPFAGSIYPPAALIDVFYHAGSLVFGGGHVVLPLLRGGLVPHWMPDDTFLTGYGAAQALPGPLFSVASYLGAKALPLTPLTGAIAGTLALSVPGLLLLTGALPYQRYVSKKPRLRSAIAGVNATVVGILGAALYDPLWTTGIDRPLDAGLAAGGCFALVRWRVPPLILVVAITIVEVAASAF